MVENTNENVTQEIEMEDHVAVKLAKQAGKAVVTAGKYCWSKRAFVRDGLAFIGALTVFAVVETIKVKNAVANTMYTGDDYTNTDLGADIAVDIPKEEDRIGDPTVTTF